MKKKNLFLAAIAITTAVSCTDSTYIGDQKALDSYAEKPIDFGFNLPAATRASGPTAASALGNQFIVYGEKSETADGAAPVIDGSTTHQLVFQNYQVNFEPGTGLSTTSNTTGWEYVGFAHSSEYQSHITTSTTDVQTIKYWDYSASNYVFTAFSAKQADLTSGAVSVTKITAKTTDNMVYDKGYTVTLTAAADPTKLYFSDRQVITQGTGTNHTAPNAYGGNVKLTFRNGVSQIRVGMYEIVPGYSVTIDKFYYVDDASPAFNTMTTPGTDKFYANVPNLMTTDGVTMHVTYYPSGDRVNQPKISIDETPHNYIALGGADAASTGLKATATLSEVITAPTYDKTSAEFTPVFPQETNNKTLKLKLDYTLTAPVTGETIKITGATAEVPAEYLQWKPNFKYTYIFKISQDTNGSSGGSVQGLYPISFDAVTVEAEDGTVETITTVATPSITTYAKASNVTSDDEYLTGSNIYVTIPGVDLTASNSKLYTATIETGAAQPINEATVANALANGIQDPTGTWTVTDANGKNMVVTLVDGGLSVASTIAAADAPDGLAVDLTNDGVKFTPAAPTYTAATPTSDPAAEGLYERSGSGTTEDPYVYALSTDATVDSGKTYYEKTATSAGVYVFEYDDTTDKHYKVIKVVDEN